jgi:hypothetical protein
VLIIHILIITQIVDFQIDHINPIDLCLSLEKRVMPFFYGQVGTIVVLLFLLRRSWPILIVQCGVLVYAISRKRKRSRVFDPITIVRESDQLKIRHGIAIGIQMISIIFGLINLILAALS